MVEERHFRFTRRRPDAVDFAAPPGFPVSFSYTADHLLLDVDLTRRRRVVNGSNGDVNEFSIGHPGRTIYRHLGYGWRFDPLLL